MEKILVIEDELTIRENLQEVLELEGFEVFTAADGRSGVQLAQREMPNLILCDIMMPELDGYGVLQSLRQDRATQMIPVIFLTAKADRVYMRQGMEQGANDYLTKPFTVDELLKAVSMQFAKQSVIAQQTQMKLNRLCNEIVFALPRELMVPLNDILGMTQFLIEEQDEIEPMESLEIARMIQDASKSLHRIAQNFLIYVSLESVCRDPEQVKVFRQTRSRSLTQDVIIEVALQVAQEAGRRADLQIEVREGIVRLSEFDLRKVIQEIVSNAFKFSKHGTPVRIVGCPSEHSFDLVVANTGRGMTEQQIAEIDALKQFDRRSFEQRGCGLGLAIAKRTVELYGGKFSIRSVPYQQTMVRIDLPGGLFYGAEDQSASLSAELQ
ncbi:response regulator [Pantanalinema rosaneae CENA516]|uniref:hybrid sensor histidine kinase/response regulator n=1 Tax=Pantanalinema rosaneae TaxID=1620701 RepID=UPI003D6E18DE